MYGVEAISMPDDVRDEFEKSQRFQWVSLLYLLTVVFLLYMVKGSSQAMKTAWIRALMGAIPGVMYLAASRVANRPPNRNFPYGYHNAYTIGYAIAATALLAMGVFLIIDSSMSLIKGAHPTVGVRTLFGWTFWSGWAMIAVLLWSAVPSFFLGRSNKSSAETLNNKVLYADAEMQMASFSSGLAAIVGILGVGLGWWWADSVAALFISLSITRDGFRNVRRAVNDALDQVPTNVRGDDVEPLVKQIEDCLRDTEWIERASVRSREMGEAIVVDATVIPADGAAFVRDDISQARQKVLDLHWRIQRVALVPATEFDDIEEWIASGDTDEAEQ
jgi:cation diffusion facilitator family transporter